MTSYQLPSMQGIEAFINAAETLSFRATAQRLNLSLSAVSYRIQTLEHKIGVSLFDRSGPTLRLTAAGTKYRERLLPIIDDLRQATEATHTRADSLILRIAAFPIFFSCCLAPRINHFLLQYPEARIEFFTLRRRKFALPDITVQIKYSDEENAEIERLLPFNIFPVCSTNLIRKFDLREPGDITKVRVIRTETTADPWPIWFAAAGLPHDVSCTWLTTTCPGLSLDLACNDVGITMTDKIFAGDFLQNKLQKIFDVDFEFPGGFYINRGNELERPIVRDFRNWLRSELADLNANGDRR